MAQNVRLLRLVVASPGDVAMERDTVEAVVGELNRTLAADRGLCLEVHRWETDAYPDFHKQGAQGVCDEVLKIEDCDILVGIFWTRFGKVTASGMTGTEHEIHKAVTSWRSSGSPHVMVFFNAAPPRLESSTKRRQWALVAEYRERFPEEGLFWEYDGAPEFERQFRRCLGNYLRQHFAVLVPKTVPVASDSVLEALCHHSNQNQTKLFIDGSISRDSHKMIVDAFSDFVQACPEFVIQVTVTDNLESQREPKAPPQRDLKSQADISDVGMED